MAFPRLFDPLRAWRERPPVVPVLRLHGTIGMDRGFRGSLSIASTAAAIEEAFSVRRAAAVAISINSPGGMPVQSTLIFKRIRALAAEKMLKVWVFVEDVAASGGYLIALAGDEIWAEDSSIVGSIGVVSASFGFDKLMERVGVERRIYTAGESKAMLDPFRPEDPRDVARLKALQSDVHASFIALVKERRGARLKGDDAALFNGEFWSGQKALDRGLIDGLGDMRSQLRKAYGDKVRLRLIAPSTGWLRAKLGLSAALPSGGWRGFGEDAIAAIEARSLWSRFGL